MHRIKWGIIGCGNVTEVKSGPAFNKIEGSELVAVMRRDAGKAKDYALRHGVHAWYSNADDLINDPDINAIYIATPPSSHAHYAIQCMEKGKAVYVEKPMAASHQECEKMQEVSQKTGIPIYVAYYRRFLPYFIQVKEILESGRLGKLLYVKVDLQIPPRKEDFDTGMLPWRVLPEIAGAGYFYDLASHQIDLFDWYFGKTADIYGSLYNRRGLYQAEDLVIARINYESGLPLMGSWCFAADESQHTDIITVFGSDAALEFSTFDFTPVKLRNSEGIAEYLPPNPENIQYWFIKNMVEELRGVKPSIANSEQALRANYIMDKILNRI